MPAFRRLLATVIATSGLVTSSIAMAAGGWCEQTQDGHVWHDDSGYTSTLRGDGTAEVYDPGWGFYTEYLEFGFPPRHIFICSGQCEGEYSDSNATDSHHADQANSYVTNGNFANNCP